MSSIRLFLAAGTFGGLLMAGSPDTFASYHQAIDNQLSTMLDRQQVPRSAVRGPVPVSERAPAQPKQDGEAEMKAFANRYWGGREREFGAAFIRFERLRPALEAVLEAEGVPKGLVAVVLVESGAQPLALSPRQARGLWQFIPETARRYGLVVNAAKDERIQLESATRAAARYLRDLYDRFGSWPLALAAYNAGENGIQAALDKGRGKTFSQLSASGLLPAETRAYVPAVLAAMGLLGRTQPNVPNLRTTNRSPLVAQRLPIPVGLRGGR
jgi:hypothetical protein